MNAPLPLLDAFLEAAAESPAPRVWALLWGSDRVGGTSVEVPALSQIGHVLLLSLSSYRQKPASLKTAPWGLLLFIYVITGKLIIYIALICISHMLPPAPSPFHSPCC